MLKFVWPVCLAAASMLCSCGTVRETLPKRSAAEQLLISCAADRAIEKIPAEKLAGKRIYLDLAYYDSYDDSYVIAALRKHIVASEGMLVETFADASLVLEVASGALSIDTSSSLIGVPELPMPIPSIETIMFPEIPLYKHLVYYGRAKILVNALDPVTKKQAFEIEHCYGLVHDDYFWLMLFGPFRWTDLPDEAK